MKTFIKSRRRAEPRSLMLTALVDVFLVLLVFALKLYSTAPAMASVPAGIRLPQASAKQPMPKSLRLEVTKEGYAIEGTPFTLEFKKGAMTEEDEQNAIRLLLEIRQLQPEYTAIALVAEESTPFSKLQPLIKIAEAVGLTEWSLVAARRN